MKYIWGIYDIYLTPSAILFSQRSYVPPSPDPRRSYVPPSPRIPEDLTSLPLPGSPKILRVPSPELGLESLELNLLDLKLI